MLILYPLALYIIDSLAFFALYASSGRPLHWEEFLSADFDRWLYIHDNLLTELSLSLPLLAGLCGGIVSCALAAMVRAAFLRAVAGSRYPLSPRNWAEAGNLFLLYLLSSVLVKLLPVLASNNSLLAQVSSLVALVAAILLIFTDYVIVYERLSIWPAIKRGIRLVRRRWAMVLLIFVVIQLVWWGVYALYAQYYGGAERIFVLIPVSRLLVESFLTLFVDLVLIFFYEGLRGAAR